MQYPTPHVKSYQSDWGFKGQPQETIATSGSRNTVGPPHLASFQTLLGGLFLHQDESLLGDSSVTPMRLTTPRCQKVS